MRLAMDEPDIVDILGKLKDAGNSGSVSFRQVLDMLGHRAFGPMLMIPAFIAVAPTGAIPGVSVLTGIIIALIAIQLLFMRNRPWLPDRVESQSLPQDKMANTIERAKPYADRLDEHIRPRLVWLTAPPFQQVLSIICILMAISMFPLALVPFAVAIPGVAVLLIGIGFTTRDGYFAVAGTIIALAALSILPMWAMGWLT